MEKCNPMRDTDPEPPITTKTGVASEFKNAQKMRPVTSKPETVAQPPIDFRYVQHGHGPCSCCGPYSE